MDLMRHLGPIMIITDVSQLSLRKLVYSQYFISVMQLVRVEREAGVMALVEMWS